MENDAPIELIVKGEEQKTPDDSLTGSTPKIIVSTPDSLRASRDDDVVHRRSFRRVWNSYFAESAILSKKLQLIQQVNAEDEDIASDIEEEEDLNKKKENQKPVPLFDKDGIMVVDFKSSFSSSSYQQVTVTRLPFELTVTSVRAYYIRFTIYAQRNHCHSTRWSSSLHSHRIKSICQMELGGKYCPCFVNV
jgi:hypothetical protein